MVDTVTDIPSDERGWLLRCLALARIVVLCGAGLSLVLYTIDPFVARLLIVLVLVVCAGIFTWARRLVNAGAIERAGVLVFAMLQMLALMLALLLPGNLTAILYTPLAAIVLALPYLRRRTTAVLLIITWVTIIVITILSEYVQILPSMILMSKLSTMLGTTVVATFVLLMLWRYHERLSLLIARLTTANQALDRSRVELETVVAQRTAALSEREARFRAVSDLLSDYAFGLTVERNGTMHVAWSTGALTRLTGYTLDEMAACNGLEGMVYPEDRAAFIAGYRAVVENRTRELEFRIVDAQGELRWLHSSIKPIWSASEQRVTSAIGALQDITERKRYEAQVTQLAFYDALTGLVNRRGLLDRLTQLLDEPGTTLTIAYLDLDRFKLVNDTLGHDAGDALLLQVAARLRACVRDADVLARLGGDEFAVVLVGMHEEQAVRVVRRMIEQFDAAFRIVERDVRVGVSVGIACCPRDGTHVGTLLQHADIAMYAAKAHGNTFCVYNASLHTYREEQLQIESDLRHAIDTNELVLHYQPICDLHTGAIVRAEALARWNHPIRGVIALGVFIPIAEESGLIRTLDRWVLRAGLLQVAAWARAGAQTAVAINLSTVSLQERDLTDYIRECLLQTGAPPAQVVIEITESAAMRDPTITVGVLDELRALGMRIALDDFGRGYASLNYLASLPVDTVKVDREFVAEIGNNHKHEGVLRALVTLCRGLGLTVVAEGVETEAQLQWLTTEGYDQAQGYYIGRPLPAAALAHALQAEAPVLV